MRVREVFVFCKAQLCLFFRINVDANFVLVVKVPDEKRADGRRVREQRPGVRKLFTTLQQRPGYRRFYIHMRPTRVTWTLVTATLVVTACSGGPTLRGAGEACRSAATCSSLL